jgi:TonB family protein
LLVAPQAAADNIPNISGFRIGMTEEEARLSAADVVWPNTEYRRTFSVTGPVRLGELESQLHLIFVDRVLDYVRGDELLTVSDSADCIGKFRSLVEWLEARAGPLDDAPDNRDSNGALPSIETAGGSIIRLYEAAPGASASAEAHAAAFVEARAWAYEYGGSWRCSLHFEMSGHAPPPPDLPQSNIRDYTWASSPTSRDFARYYPYRAVEVGRPGYVVLICTVVAEGALDCAVGYEGPQGWGFGEAALRISRHFRIAPDTKDGASTAGATVRVPIRFSISM